MNIEELKKEIRQEVSEYIDSFEKDIYSIIDNALENIDTSNMILDVNNFIFEMNKENNLLTVALKEFIEYYIKYKNK